MTPREPDVNPLLDLAGPARYDAIRAADLEPGIRSAIADAEALRARLVADAPRTWEGLVAPLDEADERVERAWSAITNLDATVGSDDIRDAHRAAQALHTGYAVRLGQDEPLFRAMRDVAEGPGAAASLTPVRRKILADVLRDFRLAGVDLPAAKKARARDIKAEIAELGSTFADHVTDETREHRFTLTRREELDGLPATAVDAARALALRDDPAAPAERWSFTFDHPSFAPFLSYARRRDLRERFLHEQVTRATRGAHDNTPLLGKILTLRKELAGLLGFANYAELSLAPKMARSPAEVRAFLVDLATKAMPRAREEYAELGDLARREDGLGRVERHDVRYYAEKLRERSFGFSQEDLRPFFPLPRVVEGLGAVLGRLYGVEVRDRTAERVLPTWHDDVRVLEVSENGRTIGHVLFDPFARPGKRQGAWVSPSTVRRRRVDGSVQPPVAHLVCNFPAPVGGRPSLLSHEEVRTFFHEWGHALHLVLSTVDERRASGFHGVPWDGVEFPSQFHENWIWDPESLALISGHVDTGRPLPPETLGKMLAARRFLAGIEILRQCEFALVDLDLHTDFDPSRDSVRDTVLAVRKITGVVPEPPEERFENAFLHIFHGGYAAGYYGYKWAEVLAADAFGRFREEGIFAPAAARSFRATVLSRGGSTDFLELFREFRGRDPDPAALLQQAGIG